MNKAVLLLLSFLALNTGCESTTKVNDSDKPAKITELIGRAQNLLNSGKTDAAIEELKSAVKLDPKSAFIHRVLAKTYLIVKKPTPALEELKIADKLQPNQSETAILFGSAYMTWKMWPEAKAYFNKALAQSPEIAETNFFLGYICSQNGEKKQASDYFTKFISKAPYDSRISMAKDWLEKNNFAIPNENEATTLLARKKFAELESYINSIMQSKEHDTDGNAKIELAYNAIAVLPNHKELEEDMLKQYPKSSVARALLGAAYITYAYKARGNGFNGTVTTDNQILFKERIKQAEVYLKDALKMDAKNVMIPAQLMIVGKVIPYDRATMDKYLSAAIHANPDVYASYNNMLQYLAPKWGGNQKDMFDFVREAGRKSGPNSIADFTIVMAHWEMANSYYNNDPKKYFSQPQVWSELKSTFDKLLNKFPNSSMVKNMYARTAYYADDVAVAKKQFAAIKDDFNLTIWWGGVDEIQKVRSEIM